MVANRQDVPAWIGLALIPALNVLLALLVAGCIVSIIGEDPIEALDILDSIIQMPELRLDMMLEPGDIQFANNHLVLHSRTSFESARVHSKKMEAMCMLERASYDEMVEFISSNEQARFVL